MASCWLLRWQRLRLMLRSSHPSAATTVDTVENLSKFSNFKKSNKSQWINVMATLGPGCQMMDSFGLWWTNVYEIQNLSSSS